MTQLMSHPSSTLKQDWSTLVWTSIPWRPLLKPIKNDPCTSSRYDSHSKCISLKYWQAALENYKDQLRGDSVVNAHLSILYDTLLQQNLCRLIEPFSRVEISHIAKLIELDATVVERKLSQVYLSLCQSTNKLFMHLDDLRQDDHGHFGSRKWMSGAVRTSKRRRSLPCSIGDFQQHQSCCGCPVRKIWENRILNKTIWTHQTTLFYCTISDADLIQYFSSVGSKQI